MVYLTVCKVDIHPRKNASGTQGECSCSREVVFLGVYYTASSGDVMAITLTVKAASL